MDTLPPPGSSQQELSQYVLLLLGDSNLPTGGFIASAGLESYVVHGLLTQCAHELHPGPARDSPVPSRGAAAGPPSVAQTCSAFLSFLGSSLDSYARSSMPFLADAHRLTVELGQMGESTSSSEEGEGEGGHKSRTIDGFLQDFARLDEAYHSLVLNHVARRASCAQGIAFLTLFSKAFSKQPELASDIAASIRRRTKKVPSGRPRQHEHEHAHKQHAGGALVSRAIDALKLSIRRGTTPGHLPLCFGVITAALGLDFLPPIPTGAGAAHLHLFLQARALLSTAIRLNIFGPYLAHQMLLFHVRSIVNATLDALAQPDAHGCGPGPGPSTGLLPARGATGEKDGSRDRAGQLGQPRHPSLRPHDIPVRDDDASQGWAWDWADEGAWAEGPSLSHAPTTTWPLGEIAQARHDQLQSRLFNS
ncbi:hypothetical protein OC834_005097 [Tilletia horrida]|nr:hypothetical protein OC834_005097 [Tilletia horrida]